VIQALEQVAGGIRIRLKVQPRASRTEVLGVQGDMLKVRLSAPPVDGAANEALLRFLSNRLSVPRSAVRLISGQASRSKVVLIQGAGLQQVRESLGIS
jgi:uncharacterized protein